MTGPERDDERDDRRPDRDGPRTDRERRATDAMSAIQRGADPVAEAFRLAESFSSEQESRLGAWWRRITTRRPPRD